MKHLQPFLQWITLLLVCTYSGFVFVRMNLGRVYLPFHDGYLLFGAIVVGILWIIWPSSDEDTAKDPDSSFSMIGLLSLTGLLFVQIIDVQPSVVYMVAVLVAGGLLLAGSIVQEQVIPDSIAQYLDEIRLGSVPLRLMFVILLTGLTCIPWLVFILGTLSIPITWITVWATAIVSVAVGIFIYGFGTKRLQQSGGKSFWEGLPGYLRNGLHGAGLLFILVLVGGVAGWTGYTAFQPPVSTSQSSDEKQSEITLQSMGWQTALEGGIFENETAFFPDTELAFAINPEESGEYLIDIDGYLSDLGGQVRVRVDQGEDLILEQSLTPLQCELWIDNLGLQDYVSEDACPRLWVNMKTQVVDLEAGQEYTLTLEPGDDFTTAFHPELLVTYGGYIRIRQPELEKI